MIYLLNCKRNQRLNLGSLKCISFFFENQFFISMKYIKNRKIKIEYTSNSTLLAGKVLKVSKVSSQYFGPSYFLQIYILDICDNPLTPTPHVSSIQICGQPRHTPDICHRRHRWRLCKQILKGVKFSRLNAKNWNFPFFSCTLGTLFE